MRDESVLGNRMRQRRGELGMSLNDLAAATGLHKSFLSRLESGEVRQPATDSLRRIARALGLPETELYCPRPNCMDCSIGERGISAHRSSPTCAPSTTCPTTSSPMSPPTWPATAT
jgi:transcriptional regulator with XRE-family HTH domain